MESTESRFAHLLQPIRELTKNWDMDVAAELNDYLEELDEMCITLDDGKIQLNFAEAALLIQGSACIYSKKVEMLHNLVFKTLDYIRDGKNKRSKDAAERDGAAAHRDDNSDDDYNFREVDIEVADWVDKPEVGPPVKVVPLPPVSLIPPESRDKNKFPLISVKGEMMYSQKDFRINIYLPGLDDLIHLTPSSSAPLQDAGVVDFAPGGPKMTADGPEQSFLPADMEVERDAMGVDEHIERQQAPRAEQPQVVHADVAAPPALSLRALHDPYATLEVADTPFRSGKIYKVPAGLDDKGKRKRPAAPPLQDFRTWFKQTYDPPERKLGQGPTCIDLNYIYQTKLRSKRKRTKDEASGARAVDGDLRRLEDEKAQERHQDPLEGARADEDEPDVEAFEVGGDDASPEDELTYQELVKLRVEQMARNCQDYAQQTALSRRVQQWEEQLWPILLQQETRPPFDIHQYGDRIVSALDVVGRRRTFSSIVCGLDNVEACKLLLASLHLANEHTVAIDSAAGLEESVDSMALTLLSGVRAVDRFQNLAAPPHQDGDDAELPPAP